MLHYLCVKPGFFLRIVDEQLLYDCINLILAGIAIIVDSVTAYHLLRCFHIDFRPLVEIREQLERRE